MSMPLPPIDAAAKEPPTPPYLHHQLPPTFAPRRRRRQNLRHRGGAWKVAYADLTTALMAFFLLMWIIHSTTPSIRVGIAEYFSRPLFPHNPIIQESPPSSPKVMITPLSQGEGLSRLQEKLLTALYATPPLTAYRNQLRFDELPEGLRLQIIDAGQQPMFALSSAELEPTAHALLHQVAQVLNTVDNPLSIAGHTDATPYTSSNLGNWQLSLQRAGAALRALEQGGLDANRVLQVVGHADRLLLDPAHPTAPINRRISILILTNQAAAQLLQQQKNLEVESAR